jgi:AcrR family transcriptional regulator
MKTKRAYTMGARAQAVEATRRRILDATFALAQSTRIADIGLDAVAAAADVSVQTLLRQFGTRAGLMDAAMDHANRMIAEERATPAGDVDAAMRVLVDHYELRGDTALLLLSQEAEVAVRPIVEAGKAAHRRWVRAAFAPFDGDEDLLVVATDVYTWKLLRRDRGHSRARTETLMTQLVRALLTDRSQ